MKFFSEEDVRSLRECIYHGQFEAVKFLIERNMDLVNASDEEGCTMLMYAARTGKTEIAELLMDAGANVNSVDKNEQDVITSIADDTPDILKLLVERGAKASFKTFSFLTDEWYTKHEQYLQKKARNHTTAANHANKIYQKMKDFLKNDHLSDTQIRNILRGRFLFQKRLEAVSVLRKTLPPELVDITLKEGLISDFQESSIKDYENLAEFFVTHQHLKWEDLFESKSEPELVVSKNQEPLYGEVDNLNRSFYSLI